MDQTGSNERLRGLLKEAAWPSHDAAARAVNRVAAENGVQLRTNKSSISHWLNGTRPQTGTVTYLAEAISRRVGRKVHPADLGYGDIGQTNLSELPDDPIAALARLGRADMDRREVLTSAAYSLGALLLPMEQLREHAERTHAASAGRSIGQAEVDVVKQVIATFDFADERLGGGFGRRALIEYLTTDVAAYCKASGPQQAREAMYSAAMQLAYLAGWKSHDLMQEGLAQRYYLFAFDLAMQSDDKRQAAYVMRILAHQAFDLGHHANCLDLAETSTRLIRGQADPHTEALFTMTVARAHAMRGEKRQALAAVAKAEKVHEHASLGDTRPTWVKLRHNYGQYHSHVAKTLVDLGDLDNAAKHFELSLDERAFGSDHEAHALITGLSQAWLAEVQFKAGRTEQAFGNWASAVQRLQPIQSVRGKAEIQNMRAMLAPLKRRNISDVNRLLAMSATVAAI